MDRRAEKSRTALLHALTELMATRDWDEINVSVICERANTSRSTFYEHFDTKSDLLTFGFSLLEAQLSVDHPARGLDRAGTFAFIPSLLNHIRSHTQLFRQAAGSVSQSGIFSRFRDVVDSRSQMEIRSSTRWRGLSPDAILFLNGGMFAMVERWHRSGCRESCDDLLPRIDMLSSALLQTFEVA